MSLRNTLGLAGLPVGLTAWLSGGRVVVEDGAITIVLSRSRTSSTPARRAARTSAGWSSRTSPRRSPRSIPTTAASRRASRPNGSSRRSTWRFKLARASPSTDGEPFNAEAVKFSIERTLDERIDCEIRIKFFGNTEVTPVVVDEHTIDIKTTEPAPIMPTMMGTMTIVSPNTVVGERTREPVGTGPYVFDQWNVGQNIVLERF